MSDNSLKLPEMAYALPELLEGNLAKVAEIILAVDGTESGGFINFAEMLLVDEMHRGNKYSVLERERIFSLGSRITMWIILNFQDEGPVMKKMCALSALALAVVKCAPDRYRRELAFCRAALLDLWQALHAERPSNAA